MQLAKAEALGLENDHHRSVRHIDANLNDRRSDENLGVAVDKLLHFCFLVGRLHLTMNLAETELREHLLQHFEAVLQILQVYLLTLFDEGEDDIHLSSLAYLVADAVVERRQGTVEDVLCHHRLTARWQLIDDTDVEVAIEGHRQRSRYGCRRHY